MNLWRLALITVMPRSTAPDVPWHRCRRQLDQALPAQSPVHVRPLIKCPRDPHQLNARLRVDVEQFATKSAEFVVPFSFRSQLEQFVAERDGLLDLCNARDRPRRISFDLCRLGRRHQRSRTGHSRVTMRTKRTFQSGCASVGTKSHEKPSLG